MRLFFAFLYSVILTVATVVIWFRHEPSNYIAAVDLYENKLLRPDDLKYVEDRKIQLEPGAYAKHRLTASERVSSSDVSSFPRLRPRQGFIMAVLLLEENFVKAGSVNAGTMVRICVDKKSLSDSISFKVASVVCYPDPNPSLRCIAAVDIPADQISKLSTNLSANSFPSVRPADIKCE